MPFDYLPVFVEKAAPKPARKLVRRFAKRVVSRSRSSGFDKNRASDQCRASKARPAALCPSRRRDLSVSSRRTAGH